MDGEAPTVLESGTYVGFVYKYMYMYIGFTCKYMHMYVKPQTALESGTYVHRLHIRFRVHAYVCTHRRYANGA